MKTLYFLRLSALMLSMGSCLVASASSIRIQQECGFGFYQCGPTFDLVQNGPSVTYQVNEAGLPIFSLAYLGDDFVMTALVPNSVASEGGLPYGFDIYRGGGPYVQKWGCIPQSGSDCSGGTAIEFFSWMEFPENPVATKIVHIPSVPEPAAYMLAIVGAALIALNYFGSPRKKFS